MDWEFSRQGHTLPALRRLQCSHAYSLSDCHSRAISKAGCAERHVGLQRCPSDRVGPIWRPTSLEEPMKSLLIMLAVAAIAAACSYRSETTVQRPAPAPVATVVTAPPPPPSVVYVPSD